MAETGEAVEQFLRATEYVDSDASGLVAFGQRVAGATGDPVGRAVALYHEVRDGIVYTPYCDFQSRETYRASACLARGSGFCVAKAAQLHLDGRWVKATPLFDRALCERFGVRPLEFDGRADSLFHAFDAAGRRHMEYVRD